MKVSLVGPPARRSHIAGSFRGEDGASLVEFAMLVPFLILLLLGIIEFGYLLGEFNDVRHGAREGARVAAVNTGENTFLHNATCDAMDLTSNVTVQFTEGATGTIGDTGTVQVTATPGSLSGVGLIEIFLPDTLASTVEFRLEQDSEDWSTDATPVSC
ncbi:MAG: TadE/TadG family type IV pilus assembly protein [Acidimicrobiia bacterium]